MIRRFQPGLGRDQNPQDEKVAVEFVCRDCPPDRLDWALSTRVMFYARRALEQPCPRRAWPRFRRATSCLPTIGRFRQSGNAKPLASYSE